MGVKHINEVLWLYDVAVASLAALVIAHRDRGEAKEPGRGRARKSTRKPTLAVDASIFLHR